jgi:hypothetical protein
MDRTGKENSMFNKLSEGAQPPAYPDFDAMWTRIESSLPGPEFRRLPVSLRSFRKRRLNKTLIGILAAVMLAGPTVLAAISYNWTDYLYVNGGIRSALMQGLGQPIEQTVTVNGTSLTLHTAVVDETRTVLLFSIKGKGMKPASIPRFSKMQIMDGSGEAVEGVQRMMWDESNQVWLGYFEAEWTPGTLQADVTFIAERLQFFAEAEHELAVDLKDTRTQELVIGQDGLERLRVKSFDQVEQFLVDWSIFFDQPEAKSWAHPRIAVFHDGIEVQQLSGGTFGKPGEQGDYTGKQYYKSGDLQNHSAAYKLMYTKKEREISKEWSFKLQLDKSLMQSGTVKTPLHIPVESRAGRMVVEEMIVTPTRIRIYASHAAYAALPYMKRQLEVNGTILRGNNYSQETPERTFFQYEIPPNLRITGDTPISWLMHHEVVRHKGAGEPIHLKDITGEKKTVMSSIGGFEVQWTYYKQDGHLYVQSESVDSRFGGINQTYQIIESGKRIIGEPITTNFLGDGNNRAIDRYADYKGTDADIYMFFYTVDYPESEMRVDLRK